MQENKTDLPQDQVARDNDGEGNIIENNILDPIQDVANEVTNDVGNNGILAAAPDDANEESVAENGVAGANGFLATPDDVNEETAAEVAPAIRNTNGAGEKDEVNNDQTRNIETMEENETGNTALGWTGLVLSIISLFFLPLLTGAAGIITGFFALRNGARTLGMWAIAIGAFSIILNLIIAPFIR